MVIQYLDFHFVMVETKNIWELIIKNINILGCLIGDTITINIHIWWNISQFYFILLKIRFTHLILSKAISSFKLWLMYSCGKISHHGSDKCTKYWISFRFITVVTGFDF